MSPSSNSLAARLRQVRLNRRADAAPRKAATWDLVRVALLVPVLTVVTIAVILAVVRLLAGASLSGIGSATAAGWLAVNQVSVTIGGVTLGILPLLPTLLMCAGTVAVVAQESASARELPDLVGIVGAAIGGSLLVTALSLAVVADGSAVSPIAVPDSLQAFGYTLLVQGAAVIVGVGVAGLGPVLDEFAVPATERVGVRGGAVAFGVIVVGGAALTLGGVLTHWGTIRDMIADGNTFDGYLGLTGLSILYLPNMILGASSVSVGASAQLGTTVVDAFDVAPGAVPPLPIVGVLPETGVGGWGALMFVIPVAAGLVLGWFCRSHDPIRHLRAVVIGAATAAALVVLFTWLAGGRLGELGHSGVNVPTAGVFTFAWLALIGSLVVGARWLADGGVAGRRRAADAVGDDLDDWFDDPDPDTDAPVDDAPVDGAPVDDAPDADTSVDGEPEATSDSDSASESDSDSDTV